MTHMLDAFLSWWLGELAAVMPWIKRTEPVIAVWRDGRITPTAFPKGAPVTLRLADSKPWRRTFDLPKSAKRFLREIVSGEMDRRTPWRADQVYFHVAPDQAPAEAGRMMVALTLVPRQAAAPALEALARLGISPAAIELCDDASVPLSAAAARISVGSGRAIHMATALLMVSLLSVAVQAIWLGITEVQLTQARQDARSVRTLASDIARLRRQQDLPHIKREETQGALTTLDALAHALPNDSWAESVTLKDGKLAMTGQSADATRLLPLIGGTDRFADAKFDAPVTAAAKGGQNFALSATLNQAGGR